ncbi:hypothetical protein E2562_000965 [Oryza meyeriana var. granulata]|uniref:F-box domain-containing protein n=1 Tax=Oryza meyeriana var. granulata TaxID=110450 RepID=A0A6G1CYI2_9ORYZ|nr:hypothetical protein E2562_000965 [Oryza meyeriana var. granulata]
MDRDRDRDGDGRVGLSDLPDDILACILARLGYTHAAARTSALSRSWRYVWTCCLFLRHYQANDSSPVRFAAHAASASTNIHVLTVKSIYCATGKKRVRAALLTLSLGFLGLSLPPSGVFAALRELRLEHVQFQGECTLDDAMLPFLEWLEIRMSRSG